MSNIYKKLFRVLAVAFAVLMVVGCERRELYVYGDEFESAVIDVDWREYASINPDGMTMWFYSSTDPSRAPYRNTTANVRHHSLYLPGGVYQGVVIDYSPEEYSHQEFFDLDDPNQSRVVARPAAYQPDSLPELYGEVAFHEPLPYKESTGFFTVSDEPEEMALDTLKDMTIPMSKYGDYIPYKERQSYQESLVVTEFESVPHSIINKFRIRVYVKGIDYLWQTKASFAGLSDGHFLVMDKNTDTPCMIALDNWEYQRTGENEGYIAITFTTFGLRPNSIKSTAQHHAETRVGEREPDYPDPDWYSYISDLCDPQELRLNLHLTLRDHATVMTYHFDLGKYVVYYDNQHVLRIDLNKEDFINDPTLEPIDLPYVDPYNGAGFNAEVTPWKDMPPIDIPM